MRGIIEEPKGLVYKSNFLSETEEQELLTFVKGLAYEDVTMHGRTAKRTVRHFGLRYNYGSRKVEAGEPIPKNLLSLVNKAEKFAQLRSEDIVEALVNRYPIGSAIGWHHDAVVYGTIIGISLGAPCIMQFQHKIGDSRLVYERILNPRSAYIMRGEARDAWQHHIPAIKRERYSITFRSLR